MNFLKSIIIFTGETASGLLIALFWYFLVHDGLIRALSSGSGQGGNIALFGLYYFILSSLPVLIHVPIFILLIHSLVIKRFGIVLGIFVAFALTNILNRQDEKSGDRTLEAVRSIDFEPIRAHDLVVFDGDSNISNLECLHFLQSSKRNSLAHRFHDYEWQLDEWEVFTYNNEHICQPGSQSVQESIGTGAIRYELCKRKVDHLDMSNALIYTEQWSSRAPAEARFLPVGFSGLYTTIAEINDSQGHLLHVTLNGSMHAAYEGLFGIYRNGIADQQIHINTGVPFPANRTCQMAAGPSAHPN